VAVGRRTRAGAERTLVVEAVDAVDGRTLVVATQQEEVLRVLDLVCEQQAHALEAVLAPIHVVPVESAQAGSDAAFSARPSTTRAPTPPLFPHRGAPGQQVARRTQGRGSWRPAGSRSAQRA